MWKRLLSFFLFFCLGLLSTQLFKLKKEDISQKPLADSLLSNNFQITQRRQADFSKYLSSAKNCLNNFQNAIAIDDRKTVVSLIHFPTDIQLINKKNKSYFVTFKNETEFLMSYDKIFDKSFKQVIAKLRNDQLLYCTSGELFVYGSSLRFARFKIDSENFEVKVTRINK